MLLLSSQGFCSFHRAAGLGGRVLAAELMRPSVGQIWSLGAVAAAGVRAPSCPSHGTLWEVVSPLPRELAMPPRLSYHVWKLHLGGPVSTGSMSLTLSVVEGGGGGDCRGSKTLLSTVRNNPWNVVISQAYSLSNLCRCWCGSLFKCSGSSRILGGKAPCFKPTC